MRGVLNVVLGDRAKEVRIFAGGMVKHEKPAPDIYLLAATELKVSPSGCVVIEDSNIGCKAAKVAGMRCIVTFNGCGPRRTRARAARLHLTPRVPRARQLHEGRRLCRVPGRRRVRGHRRAG